MSVLATRRALLTVAALPLLMAACGQGAQTGAPTPAATPTPAVTSTVTQTSTPPRTQVPVATAHPDEGAGTGGSPGRTVVLFTGDLMLARSVGERIVSEGPEVPWEGVSAHLATPDLRVGTLETAIGTAGEAEDKAYTFQAPPEAVDSLLAGGFDVVTLANNHSYDFGAEGLLATLALLDDAGIGHVGAGADDRAARTPVVLSSEGVDLAFLGYVSVPDDWTGYRNRDWAAGPGSPGVAWAEPGVIAADVAAAAELVDHVVVLLHAGDEGSTTVNGVQVAAAQAALGAGASAVVGSHPHVLQGYQLEQGKLVAWSLGNAVFDGFTDPASLETALLTVTFTPEGIEEVSFAPVVVDGRGFPVAVDPEGETGRAILDRLASLPDP